MEETDSHHISIGVESKMHRLKEFGLYLDQSYVAKERNTKFEGNRTITIDISSVFDVTKDCISVRISRKYMQSPEHLEYLDKFNISNT